MKSKRIREGKPLPDTSQMKVWRDEYNALSEEEHREKLMSLGLADDDFKEFREALKEEKKKK